MLYLGGVSLDHPHSVFTDYFGGPTDCEYYLRYKKVYPKKLTAYKKHKYSGDELTKHIIGTDIPKKQSRGTVKDIINVWRQFYKKQKWDKLARFNTNRLLCK